jgi:hypothetical protein
MGMESVQRSGGERVLPVFEALGNVHWGLTQAMGREYGSQGTGEWSRGERPERALNLQLYQLVGNDVRALSTIVPTAHTRISATDCVERRAAIGEAIKRQIGPLLQSLERLS